MVTNQAGLKRNGVQDFVTLRATAFIMTAFSLYMAWFFISTPTVTFDVWQSLFASVGMKVFTAAALVSIMFHLQIGMWQVLTDYVKPVRLRAVMQYLLNIVAFVYMAYGLFVLWGV